jgi:hypothetical protein
VASGLAAAGFELAYLSLSLLTLRPELRQHARMVALGAVITAIALNGLADYAHRVAGGLASWAEARRLFDPLALILSLAESAPLAGLAFALASLLHRLAEAEPTDDRVARPAVEPATPAPTLAWARETAQPRYPAPELVAATHREPAPDAPAPVAPALRDILAELPAGLSAGNDTNTPVAIYRCRHCGAEGLTKSEQLAHGRQHAAAARRAAEG